MYSGGGGEGNGERERMVVVWDRDNALFILSSTGIDYKAHRHRFIMNARNVVIPG